MSNIDALSNHEVFDKETEKEYILRYKLKGDMKARNDLVERYMRLVISRVMVQRKKGLHNIEIQDLVSEGTIGLLTAIDKFDPNRLLIDNGLRLGTYAVWWIDAYIKPAAMDNISVVHKMSKNKTKSIFTNLPRTMKSCGFEHPLSQEQLKIVAEKLGCKTEEVYMVETLRNGEVSLNTPIRESDNEVLTLADTIEDTSIDTEYGLYGGIDFEKIEKVFESACSKLSERDKQIMKTYFFESDNNSIRDLSRKYGLTKERIRQIQYKNRDQIINNIRDRLCIKKVA